MRQPWARLAAAKTSATTCVAGFVMTSISSPQRRMTNGALDLTTPLFSRLDVNVACARSHGELSSGVNVFDPPSNVALTSSALMTLSVRSAALYCAAGIVRPPIVRSRA